MCESCHYSSSRERIAFEKLCKIDCLGFSTHIRISGVFAYSKIKPMKQYSEISVRDGTWVYNSPRALVLRLTQTYTTFDYFNMKKKKKVPNFHTDSFMSMGAARPTG